MHFCDLVGLPDITYYSREIVAFEGDQASLMCNASSDEDSTDPVQISWYSGSVLLKPDGKHMTIYNEYDNTTNQMSSVLSFDPVNHTDHGEYICRAATYSSCYTENKINLTVECKSIVTILYVCLDINIVVFSRYCNNF